MMLAHVLIKGINNKGQTIAGIECTEWPLSGIADLAKEWQERGIIRITIDAAIPDLEYLASLQVAHEIPNSCGSIDSHK